MSDQTTEQELFNATTFKKLQSYVKRTGLERGFSDETAQDSFMLLIEELGEVAKAMRPLHGIKVADDSVLAELSYELADVQLLLMSLCNKLDVDMGDAVIAKELKNRRRKWR